MIVGPFAHVDKSLPAIPPSYSCTGGYRRSQSRLRSNATSIALSAVKKAFSSQSASGEWKPHDQKLGADAKDDPPRFVSYRRLTLLGIGVHPRAQPKTIVLGRVTCSLNVPRVRWSQMQATRCDECHPLRLPTPAERRTTRGYKCTIQQITWNTRIQRMHTDTQNTKPNPMVWE